MIKTTCDQCEKEYETYKAWLKYKHRFCSKKCKYEWNKTVKGYWKGKKMPMSARKKMSENHADVSGSKNPRWKGGRITDKSGYILIWKPKHPYCDYHGYVREHRLVMEDCLGRILNPKEVIHHINENKEDNRRRNLKLFKNHAEHRKYHAKNT